MCWNHPANEKFQNRHATQNDWKMIYLRIKKKKKSTLFQFRVVDYLEIHMPFSQTAFDDLFIWNLLKNPT